MGRKGYRTPFGAVLALIRARRGETQVEMAIKLGRSSSFLSAMETGHVNPSRSFCERIEKTYELTTTEIDDLYSCLPISVRQLKIILSRATQAEREAAHMFTQMLKKGEISCEDAEFLSTFIQDRIKE